MKLLEFFNAIEKNTIIMEGIDHPEDLIISNGSIGAERVLKDLASLEKDTKTVSIKWDGFPAVVFGRDASGSLVFMDKHMYDKVVKGNLDFMTIKDYDMSRDANRSDLWEKESVLRPALEKCVPNVRDQFWMGDLMWTGTPSTDNGYFVFKPNTVEYRVGIEGELGSKISSSIGGIAVHTFIPGLGQPDSPLVGLKGLSEDAGVVFLVGEMRDKPTVSIDEDLLSQTQQTISNNKQAVDKFINELTAMKGKAVITAMGPFITRMLEENDIATDIVPRFLEFLKERLNDKAQEKFLGTKQDGWLYQEDGGAPGLLGMWQMWASIVDLKNHIKQQIDTQQQGSEVIAITDGINAHEGYVFGAGKDKLKLIDRLGFSRANFAKHRVPDEEIAAKSQMPLAVFCFGRMNPPTLGHNLVMKKTIETGGENSFIFLSNSVGKDDPLDPATKATFISKVYPDYASHIVTDYVQTPIYAANWLYAKGFRNMAFVAGSDRLGKEKGSLEKLLNSWNSGPIRSTDPAGAREHVVMQYISAGDRDPESAGVEGYSGTKAREAAVAGDEQKFQQYTGIGPEITVNGKTLYQAVREGLGIEDQEQPQQPVPVTKPAVKAQPKPTPGKAPARPTPGKAQQPQMAVPPEASLEPLDENLYQYEKEDFTDTLKGIGSKIYDIVHKGTDDKNSLQKSRDALQSGTAKVDPNSTMGRINAQNKALKDTEDDLTKENIYQYDKEDPFNSTFAPSVGMGSMTLRGWKQSLARRVVQFDQELQSALKQIDSPLYWENIYKKFKALNLDPIAQEIELAHQELEAIRRKGGKRANAFKPKVPQS